MTLPLNYSLKSNFGRSAHPVGSSILLLAGFGFISRMYGLSVDNLVEVEMVLADGRIVILDKDSDPGKC